MNLINSFIKRMNALEFSRQEYWSGLPFPSPGDLPNPGIEPGSPAWQADSLSSVPPENPKMNELMVIKLIFKYNLYPIVKFYDPLGFSFRF